MTPRAEPPDRAVHGISGGGSIPGAPGRGPAAVWQRYGRAISAVAVAYLVVAAAGRLYYALPYLLRDVAPWSAVDLKYRYNEVAQWFAGNPVYGVVDGAVYPPASYAILWPLIGWVPLDTARLIWALTTLAAAAVMGMIAYRVCAPAAPMYRLLVAGLAFAAYPLQLAIFPGQMGMHVIALVAGGAFLIWTHRPAWWSDALAGVLIAAALVKPTTSVPLVIAALISGRRVRPAVLVAGAYAALTMGAAAAQPTGLVVLLREWLAVAGERVPVMDGVPNLHLLLASMDLRPWANPASLVALALTTTWLWRHRAADPWLLLAVAAIVTRFWAHSTLYDDGFLLVAAIALFRVASRGSAGGAQRVAPWLFAAAWAALLTPTWVFYDAAPRVVQSIHLAQALLWVAVLAVLAAVVRQSSPAYERNLSGDGCVSAAPPFEAGGG
jgi:hypothetical protein